MVRMKRSFLVSLSLAALVLGGCVSTPKPVSTEKPRVFFPFPPEVPKVEFKGAYRSENDFPKKESRFLDALLGENEGEMRFKRPTDIASNGEGMVYISDAENGKVYVYDLVNYNIHFLAEGKIFKKPLGLATDGDGHIYVVDKDVNKVLVFDRDEKPLNSIGGSDYFDWPVGVAVDDNLGRVYVTDTRRHSVSAFDKKGGFLFSFGKKGGADGEMNFPVDLEVAPDGSIVVVDMINSRVQIFDSSGKFVRAFGKRGDNVDAFSMLKGVGIDSESHIYLTDADTGQIKIYNMEGSPLLTFGGKFPSRGPAWNIAGFGIPSGIDVDKKNGIHIADQYNQMFQVFQYLDAEYLKNNPLPEIAGEEADSEKTEALPNDSKK